MSKGLNELDARQMKAIGLLVARDINKLTYQEIADKVGVSSQTLFTWRHNRPFRQELNRQADEIVETYITDVYKNLGRILSDDKAHDRDKINAGNVILKLQGKYKDTVEVNPSSDMEELLAKLNKM